MPRATGAALVFNAHRFSMWYRRRTSLSAAAKRTIEETMEALLMSWTTTTMPCPDAKKQLTYSVMLACIYQRNL